MADSESELERRMKLPPLARDEREVPEGSCVVCGESNFWERRTGKLWSEANNCFSAEETIRICSRCHPPVS